MSIYSGFPTREKESKYNQYLYRIAQLVRSRVLGQFMGEPQDDVKFSKYFIHFFKRLRSMDMDKHLEPQFNTCFQKLAVHILKNKEEILGTSNLDTSSLTGISVSSSRISKHMNSVSPSKKRLTST